MAEENTGTETGKTQDAAGTSTDTKTEGQTTETKTDTSTDQGSKGGDKTEGKIDSTTPKSFTQDELDAIVQKRLAKEKTKWEKDKDLPELDKLRQEKTELEKKVREREIGDAFATAANTAGAKNVDRLLKIYRNDLEISDKGEVENLKEIFDSAKRDFPEFFAKGSADGGAGKDESKLTTAQIVDAEFQKTGRTHGFKL